MRTTIKEMLQSRSADVQILVGNMKLQPLVSLVAVQELVTTCILTTACLWVVDLMINQCLVLHV